MAPTSPLESRNPRSDDLQATRAAGVTVSLAAVIALCWAVLTSLAVTGALSVVEAVLIAAVGYMVLAAGLWGFTGITSRRG